jgi:pyruvate kinase
MHWAENEGDIDFIVFKQIYNLDDLEYVTKYQHKNFKKVIGINSALAVEHMEKIFANTDGVVISRGLLSLQSNLMEVCRLQKYIISRCNMLGIPVIISTQILDSLIV